MCSEDLYIFNKVLKQFHEDYYINMVFSVLPYNSTYFDFIIINKNVSGIKWHFLMV